MLFCEAICPLAPWPLPLHNQPSFLYVTPVHPLPLSILVCRHLFGSLDSGSLPGSSIALVLEAVPAYLPQPCCCSVDLLISVSSSASTGISKRVPSLTLAVEEGGLLGIGVDPGTGGGCVGVTAQQLWGWGTSTNIRLLKDRENEKKQMNNA